MINAPGNTNLIDISGEFGKSDITIKLREKKFRRFKNFIEIVGYCILLPSTQTAKLPIVNNDSNNTARATTTGTISSSISTTSSAITSFSTNQSR